MWFRRAEEAASSVPFPGIDRVIDGWSALLETERVASEELVVAREHRAAGFPVPSAAPTFVDTASGRVAAAAPDESLHVRETGGDIAATLAGYAMRGVRAAALAAGGDGLAAGLAAAAGRRIPFVVHLATRAHTRQAIALRASHDAYHSLADSGAFLMFARNAQEVADFSLIAHRVAERSLTPGVVAHDLYTTSHAVCGVQLADKAMVGTYLGRAADTISTPDDAQRILFGDTRRRIPLLLDLDRPAGVGGAQDAESYFRAVAAARAFFAADLATVVDDAMRELGALSGRAYQRATAYRVDDAEFVVIAQGAVTDDLARVVDYLREKKMRAGVVGIAVLRPFPGDILSNLLKGKRAVTVLERTHSPLADPPLLAEIRAAVGHATENGASQHDAPPHAGYASYRERDDRPALLSGIHGVGTSLPSFGQLVTVFENMTRAIPLRSYFLGAGFDTETRRFPHLQTLRQRLDRGYQTARQLSLDARPDAALPRQNDGSLTIASSSAQGALGAGNLFAQALAGATAWRVHSYPEGGLDRSLQPATLSIVFRRSGTTPCVRPVMDDALVVSSEAMIETVAAAGTLRRGGTLIAASVRDAESLWRSLSSRAADWVRAESISFHVLDARRLANEAALHASFVDQLSIWALLGACVRIHLDLSAEQVLRLEQSLRDHLRATPELSGASVEEIIQVFRRGAETHSAVRWEEWKDAAHPLGEPETPHTVREAPVHDGSVFDAGRFWHSVGYLYDRGQPALALADPYLASAVVPAASSAFRDLTPYRLRLPSWLPENCTACGNCWTQCPESALPPTARTLPELIEAAMRLAERRGEPFVQIKRLAENLAKFAARAVSQGGPQPYTSLSALLTDAFARLVDKAGLDGERLQAARSEFARLCEAVDGFPLAVTEAFFAKHGRLVSLAVNPLSCNACGVCVAECADGALEWVEQTTERVAAMRRNWVFLTDLPPLSHDALASLTSCNDSAAASNRLLDGAVYHTLIGGDGSMPGNGAKTALHLIAASLESELRPRVVAHAAALSALVAGLEDRIQGNVQAGLRVNDFEEFSQRLQRLDRAAITPAALTAMVGNEGNSVDAAELARLTHIVNALRGQKERYQAGRARFVMAIDPDGGEFWHGTYPFNPHPQPWAAQRPGDAIALGLAAAETLARETAAERALCRRAAAAIAGTSDDGAQLSWNTLSADEKALAPRVLLVLRPGSLSGERVRALLASGLPVTAVILDGHGIATDEAAQPATASALDPLMLSLARDGHRVAQSSIGVPDHLVTCVIDSLRDSGPALVRVYAPEASTSGVAPERVAALARAAVASGAVPAFSCFADGIRRHVPSDSSPLTVADWAAMQARFQHHYRVVSRGYRSDAIRPLAAFLALTTRAREGIQPCIDVHDYRDRHAIALVSNEMTALCERVAERWSGLGGDQAAAAAPRAVAEPVEPAAPALAAAPAARNDEALRALTANLLQLSGFGSDDAFFQRSLREFVARGRGGNGGSE